MMQLSLGTAIDSLAFSAFLYVLIAFREHRRRRGLPYPPGLTSWPIIGNLRDIPKFSPWSAYADMSKKYGDVVCLQVFGQTIMVLSSLPAIKDLLEKRGELYSTLFVVTASVLSVFNVTRAKDKDGKEIPVTPTISQVVATFLIHAPQFECAITPRDNLSEDLIRTSALT